jgi:6-phosphogluconate dehydrogenase
MGHGLALNVADHGFTVAAFDRDADRIQRFVNDAAGRAVQGAPSLDGLLASLDPPRAVLLLVPSGPPVDAVIAELQPRLTAGDLIIDGGNSFFRDTERRGHMLAARQLHFMGLGISGGESGARHGPSLMPGGDREDYERVQPILEAIAARVEGRPCVTYLGPGAAGHYVKMVHNGIEYAALQLIAETYDLMRHGLGLDDEDVGAVYERWNDSELRSYLLEITARVLSAVDDKTGERLVHLIVDQAGQKGTGRWCSQDAMELGVPIPTIDAAVSMRELSASRPLRQSAARIFPDGRPATLENEERRLSLERLRGAFQVGVEVAYAQGMSLLHEASVAYGFGLSLSEVARIWRGGCIIRASLLERVQDAFRRAPELSSLLFAPDSRPLVVGHLPDLRGVVRDAALVGIPAPGLMSALAYLEALRSARLPANLIQAQRDYFGGHGFERVDAKGTFHGHWDDASEAEHAR